MASAAAPDPRRPYPRARRRSPLPCLPPLRASFWGNRAGEPRRGTAPGNRARKPRRYPPPPTRPATLVGMERPPPVVFPVADGITAIDTFMGGRARYTAAYLLEATETTLVETGPGTSVEPVAEALHSLGVAPDDLAHIVLTHIHLDHAGGVGRLAERFPRATVWVHQRGAPHLVDPARLVASTARVWGDAEMRELFGPTEPVAGGRVRPLEDAD